MLRNPAHSLPCLIAILAAAVYLPALPASFQFDDWQVVLGDPRVTSFSAWWQSMPGMRALLKLSYATNHESGGGVMAFRAVNILLHALNAAMLFMLMQQMGRRLCRINSGEAAIAGAVAALVFALHPAQTESVTYISGRSNVLAVFFVLSALLAWLKSREKCAGPQWIILSLLAFAAALASKEIAAVLPLAMLLCLAAQLDRPALREFIMPAVLIALAVLLFAAAWPRLPYDYLLRTSLETRGPVENLAAQSQGVVWLTGQMFNWARLNADPMLQPVTQWTPGVILKATALASVFIAGLFSLRRYPAAAFAVLWFFIWLAPTNSLIARLDVANDRQLYLAIAGPAWLLGYGIAQLTRIFHLKYKISGPVRCAIPAVLALSLVLALGTINRNRVYATETAFWQDVTVKSPHNTRAWNNLGMAEALACRPDSATRAFEEAIRLEPDSWRAQVNLELLKTGELQGLPVQCREDIRAPLRKR
jgi:tetratricopeptide (TPR) repeat protein